MGIKLITGPSVEPVTLAEAKAHARILTSDEDSLITSLIVAARRMAERRTGRAFITQTWELALDAFPEDIELPLPPAQSIDSVKYLDINGVQQTLSSTEYLLDTYSEPAWLTVAYGKSWPATYEVPNAVKIRWLAGYGDTASAVPQELRQWILSQVAYWYAQRESVSIGGIVNLMPYNEALLDSYTAVSFA